jgi:RHS repeat-associated protein
LGRLTQLKHAQSTNTLADYQLSYDAKNRLTQLKSKDGVSNYSYDSNDQITGVDHSYQTDETYSYDANGNRIDRGSKANKNNQLQSDANFNYHYDKQGNLIRKHAKGTGEETEYSWDYRNRLTQVIVKRKGRIVEQVDYTYDAFDRRIAKSVDPDGEGRAQTETERFVYDGEHIALTFDGQGKQTHRYLYGPQIDQVLADETVNGAVQWALSDQQGSVRDVINNQGQILNHIRYDSFGNITSQSNANVDFRFGYTGREFDEETGLYYYRARYYDAAIGRFISEDPMGFGAGDSNLYRYVGNSATNYTDPTGNFTWGWYAAVAATTLIPMTIAGAWFPNPAQTPTNRCDIDPTDNSGKRAAIEIVSSLGMGIASTLFKRAMSSLLDDILNPKFIAGSLDNSAGTGGVGLDHVNPGFSPNVPGSPRSLNCVNCSISTDATLAGRPASALPTTNGGASIFELEDLFGGQFKSMAPDSIISELQAAGSGARGIVYGARVNKSLGIDGHVFNVVNDNGMIKFLDGQANNIPDLSTMTNFGFLRTN